MKYFIFTLFLLLFSCSTLKRQKILGGLAGSFVLGSIGASIGKELSPNPQSDKFNQTIGMVSGGISGFYLGIKTAESLWQEYPENPQDKADNLLLPNAPHRERVKIKVIRPQNIKRIKLESKLPPFLKGRIKEAHVITYELESYEEETGNGRKIIHAPHKAYEYVIE